MSNNTAAQEAQEVIQIQEAADGSAIIDLPDSIESPDEQQKVVTSETPDDTDEDDERARQEEMASGGFVDPEAEALREQKRLKRHRRKEYHKQVQEEKNLKMDMLSRQNQELLDRLAVLEKKSHGSEIARINSAIQEQKNRIAFAKQKMSEATSVGDGNLLANAQEMWFEARRNAEALENIKKKATAPQRQRTIQAPDPAVANHASTWMSNNRWYDPKGGDADSKVALAIDEAMGSEGWNPKSAEYWEELDNRLQRYLPHRYNDYADEKPTQRRPRNVVTGSGRESAASRGGSNQFTLSREQVSAIKEAGMWDNPEKRAKMIKTYAQYARQQRNSGY